MHSGKAGCEWACLTTYQRSVINAMAEVYAQKAYAYGLMVGYGLAKAEWK